VNAIALAAVGLIARSFASAGSWSAPRGGPRGRRLLAAGRHDWCHEWGRLAPGARFRRI